MQNQNIDFLAGGGECGELIRSIDWSKTPIGAPENWPQSLRTCIRIVFTSRQPMFVWWGKELINIYNDPYKTIVGGKHPEAFGQPASIVWREIWNEVAPRAEKAMQNNEGTYDEALLLIMERNGYPEETYYTFSYSPVPGDHGEPGGIICANTDDTQRIIGERQLRTLRDLGKNIFEKKTENEVYEKTTRVLKNNPQDFPFALLYKTKPGETSAYLVKATETMPENIFPSSIDMSDSNPLWPLQTIVESGKEKIVALDSSAGKLPTGFWDKQPGKVLILPIIPSGQKTPYAFLFIGLNPYSLFDEKTRDFFQLVADQIGSNISDIRAYEDERKRAEALAEIDKAKTVFFSNISHEFRTPLTLMISPLEEALRENILLPSSIKENLEVTYRNTLRLQKLVNSLLDFSRIEAGRMQVSYQLTDISAFTRDIASNFRSAVERAGMQLIVECNTITDEVYVDRDMWEKIVLNLLSNAFKYTHHGTIKVGLRKIDDDIELSVVDTGVGIPETEIDKIFDRFHRVQHARGRTQEGTGIGLSLVQELAKLHHGNIRVMSKVNEGSSFIVTIPSGKKHLDDEKIFDPQPNSVTAFSPDAYVEEALKWLPQNGKEYATENQREKNEHKNNKPSIILADDNEDMRNYIQRLLQDEYQIISSKNGKEVLQILESQIPDLIISDVMMPEIDGFELVKRMKSNSRTANIPIVLLSARAGEEATIEGLKTGADDYLVKPFSARELLTRIDSTLKIANSRRAAEQNLKNIFTQSPVPIAVFRGEDLIVELANKFYMQIIDRDEEGFVGKPLLEGFPELEGQGIVELLKAVLNTGTPYYGNEFQVNIIRNHKKERCYFNFVYYPLRDFENNIVSVMVMANDITEQINARKAIEESSQKFRNMVMQSPIAMLILKGKDMIIDTANETLLKNIWRRSASEVEGKKIIEVFPELKDQQFPKLLNDVFETGNIVRENEAVAYVNGSDGLKKFYLDYEYAPTTEPDGTISGIIVTVANVTEKVEARQKVEETEQRSRLAIDAAEMGTFDWNLVNQDFISSPRLFEIFGISNYKQASHQDLLNAFHPEDRSIRDAAVEKSLEKGSLSYEARVIWPDNTVHWVMVNGKTTFDEHQKAMRMYGTVMDVTKEKTTLKELEESEALLKSLVDSAPVMIWMSGLDKTAILLNQAWTDFTGRPLEEELGFGWTEGIHHEDFKYVMDTYMSSFDARKEIYMEYRLKRFDGKYRWVSDKGTPRYSADGNFLGYIGGCADIHEQKMALDELEKLIAERTSELKNRNEELQQQKDFVDAILDSSVDVISVFDKEKQYLSINKRCEEVYGIKKEKIIGKKLEEVFPETINTDFYHGLSQAILGNSIHHPKYQSVITGRNYETFYIPLKHEGRVNAVLAIAHDNTDIIEASEKLQFSNIELEQKNRALERSNNELEQFAYVASHDLQEPLRKIRTYSGILHENLKSKVDENSSATLQKIMNSAERMSTLIYDLLNFSRLIHPEENFEATDLNKIIKSVIDDFELTIQQKKAIIKVEPLPLIRATPLQMNQLFYNLINNSLKFTKKDVRPEITIQSTLLEPKQISKFKNLNPELSYIDITVRDNGIGFEQQYAEQIFEVFKRLQNKNIYPGSGIGLALCKKILLNHQGDLYAEGFENEGAAFHVVIPAGIE
ncbi:MAG: PAS domain S-box protein [Bacteroidetes bacterium]|nr:PAS domain S-box protein [Bacteroidota bacterium]